MSLMLASVLSAPAMALPGSMPCRRPLGAGVRRVTEGRTGASDSGSDCATERLEAVPWTAELLPLALPPGMRSRDSISELLPQVDTPEAATGSAGSGSGGGVEARSRRRSSAADIDRFGSGEFVFAMRRDSHWWLAARDSHSVRAQRAEKTFLCSLNNRRSQGGYVKSKRADAELRTGGVVRCLWEIFRLIGIRRDVLPCSLCRAGRLCGRAAVLHSGGNVVPERTNRPFIPIPRATPCNPTPHAPRFTDPTNGHPGTPLHRLDLPTEAIRTPSTGISRQNRTSPPSLPTR